MNYKLLLKWIERLNIIWVIHFILYNTYYGFNSLPLSTGEKIHDYISIILLYTVLFGIILLINKTVRDHINQNY